MLEVVVNLYLGLIVLLFLCVISFFNQIFTKQTVTEMDRTKPKFLQKKVKTTAIDVHPTERALIVKYDLQFQILTESFEDIYEEKRELEKIIGLSTLNSKTDCNALGKTIIEKCDLIHPSKLAEVEQLIYYLKNRKQINRTDSNIRKDSAILIKNNNKTSEASVLLIDDYVELLYDDIAEKIKGSALIMQLAGDWKNLDYLSKNEALLSALARVLREDWKRSIVLSTNLIYTFFCFSSYVSFHPLILHYKIGSLCMDIIDFELTRYDEWRTELFNTEPPIQKTCPNSASMSEIPRSKIPEPIRPRSGNWSESFNNKALMNGSTYDDLSQSIDNLDERKPLTETEKIKRYRTLVKKQEQLLRVSFYLLLHMSDDSNVEEKMVKKNIVGMLVKTLERENEDLVILVVTFLKKLSVYEINKDLMSELDVIDKLDRFLSTNNIDLVHLTLRLLFNLSFDPELRKIMIRHDFLQKFVSLLSDDVHQNIIIRLLYQLSREDKVRVLFSYTDCVSLIIDMILLCRDDSCDKEMIALGVNLATDESNARQMVENNRLHNLMTRAFRFQNYLLMKMVRNIAEHKKIQPQFLDFVGDLANALIQSKSNEFIQECLGVLSNIWLPELDYSEIFNHFKLIPWIKNLLKPEIIEVDLMLDVVIFLGTVAADKECASLLCKSHIMKQLIELLKLHQEDDEIVYQIIFVFRQVLKHDETKDHVIMETDAPGYLIDLLQDQNKVVSNICDACLNIISDRNPDWARRIQIEKYRNHNAQWLQMVETHAVDEAEYENDFDELPPYMDAEYLATHSVPMLGGDKKKTDLGHSLRVDSPELLDVLSIDKFDDDDLNLIL